MKTFIVKYAKPNDGRGKRTVKARDEEEARLKVSDIIRGKVGCYVYSVEEKNNEHPTSD